MGVSRPVLGDPAKPPLARRTGGHPVGSKKRSVVGHTLGTARSGVADQLAPVWGEESGRGDVIAEGGGGRGGVGRGGFFRGDQEKGRRGLLGRR